MEIVEIFDEHLYSIQYAGCDMDEYSRVMSMWRDLDYLLSFFNENAKYMGAEIWKTAGLSPENPHKSAARVVSEADDLEKYLYVLSQNTNDGQVPDFDSMFKHLDGKYKFLTELVPQKSYGRYRPSLLRLYAIKLESNCYLIVYGGIKVGSKIQNSPVLKDEVEPLIDKVLSFLRQNGIVEQGDI